MKINRNCIQKCLSTAHNKTVCASPPFGGSGFSRLGHFALLIPTAPSPTFGRAVFASQSPYMPAQTSHTAKRYAPFELVKDFQKLSYLSGIKLILSR